MKIILEFDGDEEADIAEMSYNGPKLYAALEEYTELLRKKIKYGEHSEEIDKGLQIAWDSLYTVFGDLMRD